MAFICSFKRKSIVIRAFCCYLSILELFLEKKTKQKNHRDLYNSLNNVHRLLISVFCLRAKIGPVG